LLSNERANDLSTRDKDHWKSLESTSGFFNYSFPTTRTLDVLSDQPASWNCALALPSTGSRGLISQPQKQEFTTASRNWPDWN